MARWRNEGLLVSGLVWAMSVLPARAQCPSLTAAKSIIAAQQRIVSPRGIQQHLLLSVNGTRQWISIRGRDRRNPILLVLHGGPGTPEMPAAWTFQSPWEDYFTVVEWAQRGTGKTYQANTEAQMASGMSVAGMTRDAARIVRYLRKRFHKKKIFILGVSWGTVLGVMLAQRHPDWFYAYIGAGQVVNERRGDQIAYEFTLRAAQAHRNAKAVRALRDIAPYPGKALTIDRLSVLDKWAMRYGALVYGRKNFYWYARSWELSPLYLPSDIETLAAGSQFSLEHLLGPLLRVNFENVTDFHCPVIEFVGAHDYTTPASLTIAWFKRLRAPSKRLVIFADSAHLIMQEQPGRFLVHLVEDALPYAVESGDAAPAEREIIGGASVRSPNKRSRG